MMKLSIRINAGVAFILMQCLILNPLAVSPATAVPHDGQYNSVCKPVLDANQEQMQRDPTLGGTQASAACTNAKNARTLYKVEIAKVVLYAATAITLTALAVTNATIKIFGGDISALCSLISTVSGATAMGMDMGFKAAAQVATEHWVENVKPIASSVSTATSGLMTAGALFGKKAGETAAKEGTKAAAKEGASKASERIGCWVGVGFAVVNGTLSAIGISAAANAIKKNLEVADSVRKNATTGAIAGPGSPTRGFQTGAADMNAPAAMNSAAECSSVGGDAYLSCINQDVQDPTLSAMTSNKDFMNAMKDALGMPVGDFVKGYDGDGSSGSVGAYAANALGMPQMGGVVSASIEKAKADLAKEPEFVSKYASKAAPKSGRKDPMVDFGSMMNSMLGNLNPQGGKSKDDPKALVFRRLEAMSEERILEAKDISLFDRITRRYQKQANAPEAKAEGSVQNR
jgi:hypothetical protein